MGIMNRRNAALGWAAWKVGKGVMRKKAKGAMPGKKHGGSKKKPAIFAGLAGLGALAVLKRRRKGGSDTPEQ